MTSAPDRAPAKFLATRKGKAIAYFLAALTGAGLGLATSALAVGDAAKEEKKADAGPPVEPEAVGLAAAFLAGRHAETSADGSAAVDFYNRAMELDPQNYALLQSTYFLAAQNGDFIAAVPVARKAYESAPRRGMASVILAIDHFKKKEYADAWRYLEKTPGQSVNSIALPMLRAWSVAATQPAEAAIAELSLLKNFQDTAYLVDVMSALLNEYYGRKDAALAHYDALASDIEKERISVLRTVAEGYRRLGRAEKMKDVMARYLTAHDGSPALETYLTTIIDSGIDKVTLEAGLSEALYAAAELQLMSDQNDYRAQVAIAYSQAALYVNPRLNIARRFIGSTLTARGRFEESNTILAGYKRSDPGYADVQMQIAENLLRLERQDEAIGVLRAVLKDRPTWSDAHVSVGDVLRAQKKYAEAVASYDSALKAAPANNPANWVIHFNRGVALERSKKWDLAEKDFRKALELKPDDPDVLNYLGYSYLDRGEKIPEARKLIESAYKQRPNSGYIIDSMGWALFIAGEYEQAVASLEKAVEATPSDATINEHLGDAYWKVGRRNEARFQWERALTLDIEESQRAVIRVKLERGLAQQ